MRVASLLPALAYGAVFDEMEADYTVVVPAGVSHCYFQPMTKGTCLNKFIAKKGKAFEVSKYLTYYHHFRYRLRD